MSKNEYEGEIPYCPYQSCNFRCCEFNQNNYIVMYPGEIEGAQANNESISHLKLTPYNGGFKAICIANNTANCDNGYKPLDCRSYPFFPSIIEDKIEVNLKGVKCPLSYNMINKHANWVKCIWEVLVKGDSRISIWLNKVSLVGYKKVKNKNKNSDFF